MCYAKPGPRCSNHARKSLEHAKKVYEEDKTSENLNNYQQALNDYYSTPAGLGELRKKYEDTGDRAFLFYHAERQAFREQQLVEYNNEVERRRIAKEVFARAMDSDLDYQGPKPLWWNEYVERAKNHEDERLNTTPELLDVIETGHGKVAVVWEPSSQDDNDRFPQLEKGMHVGITRFRSLDSQEDLGYLKSTWIDDESYKRAFGDDEFTAFRFHQAYSGKRGYPFSKHSKYADETDPVRLRGLTWLAANCNLKGGYETEDGKWRADYQRSEDDIPKDDQKVKADLKKLSAEAESTLSHNRSFFEHPFVDFSRVKNYAQGYGYGSSLYVYAAKRLAKEGKVLRGSSLQTEEAQNVWKKFPERVGKHYRTQKIKTSEGVKEYPVLDFRSAKKAKRSA